MSDNMSIYGNYGVVEKPPIMDNVIYYDGTVAQDPDNEKFQSMEFGLNYNSPKYAGKVSYYNTQWKDRNLTKSVTSGQGSSGDTDVIFLTGVNQSHTGFEMEGSAQVIDMLRLDFAASFGNWKFVDDASGTKTQVSTAQFVNGLQFIAGTLAGNVATARFGGGINNTRYNITCRINTTQGLTYERSVTLPIRNR